MNDYQEMSHLMERIIHKYVQVEKIKRPYGTGVNLSRAEIHTVVAIGENPDISVTNLAKEMGVTKGAASQMIYKLVDKGLVSKAVSPDSDTQVCLRLTELGEKAYKSHDEYHATTDEKLFKSLREMSEKEQRHMIEILTQFELAMDERLQNK